MKKLLLLVWILIAVPLFAEDIYISQSGTGDGSSCSSPRSAVWFNTSGNWGAGAGEISAGDTAHLCGTITSTLTIEASGSSELPITVLFESGAKLSAPTWGGTNAINLNGKNYITIDGGTNGIIEDTDNGVGKTYQNGDDAIDCQGTACSNIEIKNLTIQNLWYRPTDSTNTQGSTAGIYINGGNNISIHNNIVTWANYGIRYNSTAGGNYSNISYYSNTASYCNMCLTVTLYGSVTLDTINLYNNDVSNMGVWDEPATNNFHHDGIIVYGPLQDDVTRFTNVKLYNNYVHGDNGTYCSSWIGTGDNVYQALIYNNLILHSTGSGPADGYFWARAGADTAVNQDHRYYNNTVIYTGSGTGSTFLNHANGAAGGHLINNIGYKIGHVFYTDVGGDALTEADYNDWYACADRTADTGAHTITTNPNLDGSYKAQSSSPIGTSLSSYFTTDKDGVTRTGSWNMGAYQYSGASYSNCDINNDGSVNATDVQALVNCILANNCTKGNLNGDSSYNILDLQRLISVILGRTSCP